MVRRPAFTVTVVATLALGIGANSAVFSLVDTVLLHPFDVAGAERLVAIYEPGRGTPFASSTLRVQRDLAARSRSLSGVAAFFVSTLVLREGDVPADLSVAFVTENYFSVLRVPAQIGRMLAPADSLDATPTVVLSDALWRGRFGADPSVVGKRLHLGNQTFTVIGVAPDRFRGTDLVGPADAWIAASMAGPLNLSLISRDGRLNVDVPLFRTFGRLVDGETMQRASAEIGQIVPTGATVVPLVDAATGIRDRAELLRFVRLLLGVVGLTLLLACVNVANLLVVRGAERATELGVRTAMGASARRLAQQLLTESVVLALAAGAAGLGAAIAMLRLLSAYTLPGGVSLRRLDLGLDPRVLAFTIGVSILTAIAFGAAPAFYAIRANVMDSLRGRETTASAHRGRNVLLAVQVGISLMLIVGAGLFVRSIQAGLNTDLGFDPRPIAAVSVQTKFDGRHADAIRPLLAIVEQSAKAPGVIAAAASSHVPLAGVWRMSFSANSRDTVLAPIASITPDYFKVLGVPMLAGRSFDDRDRAGAQRVIVINESAARTFFPGESALGKHVDVYGTDLLVVGVVRDMKYSTLQDKGVPFIYAPMLQQDFPATATLLVRSLNPRPALAMLRRTVGVLAPDLKVLADRPAYRPRLVSEQIDAVLAPQRFGAMLMSAFSLIALCISAVGIYGTVAHVVARRTTEIGVRMALGAQRRDVLSLVLRDSGFAVAGGVALGLGGALLTSKLLAHFLYEVTTTDLIAFAAAVVVVTLMATMAVLIPATRAVRVDPARAMRAF